MAILFFAGAALTDASNSCGQSPSMSPPELPLAPAKRSDCLRVATYNVSLNRPEAGKLSADLRNSDLQARRVAAVIRAVKPDVILLNELDYSPSTDNANLFHSLYLANDEKDLLGNGPWRLPYVYSTTVNTGEPSGLDLDQNGKRGQPGDAWGFGRFPGQYGMAVLSRYEIDADAVRTFQRLQWSSMQDCLRPILPNDTPFHDDHTWESLRLSSKSHWDVPIKTGMGVIHLLASHPTPPAFDGPEDRNGCRNHDEIRLLADYINAEEYIVDDDGTRGGLTDGAQFVVLGDLNSDPFDGGSKPAAIKRLLELKQVSSSDPPTSTGAVSSAQNQGGANDRHTGNPAFDTADFNDRSVGNLRVDYVLPSTGFKVVQSGVVWPSLAEISPEQRELVKQLMSASDHHMVWVDIGK